MSINNLTDKQVRALTKPGNYADGGNLYVRIQESGTKSFILKATSNGRQQEWTIGRYGTGPGQISLAEARKRRDEMMTELYAGRDPLLSGLILWTRCMTLILLGSKRFAAFGARRGDQCHAARQ